MVRYRLSYEFEEEIEADSEEQAFQLLEDRIASENRTVETDFWSQLKIKMIE